MKLLILILLLLVCLVLETQVKIKSVKVLGCDLIKYRVEDAFDGRRYDVYATGSTVCLDETANEIDCKIIKKNDKAFAVQNSAEYPPTSGVLMQLQRRQ